jgi:endoglucanase
MNRRSFARNLAIVCAAGMASAKTIFAANSILPPTERDITASQIPRWRGFNLQGKFSMSQRPSEGPAYDEFDFATMKEWGFDFARLPLSYWVWGSRDDWKAMREEPLKRIDEAIEFGRQYGIHINVNFHRIPGYSINGRELEPADLFMGTAADRNKALVAGVFYWRAFARRYPTVV